MWKRPAYFASETSLVSITITYFTNIFWTVTDFILPLRPKKKLYFAFSYFAFLALNEQAKLLLCRIYPHNFILCL